ncbi:SDR family oxidoreductase [Conexibacter stalactiti]|uniref:SDR family oxidoreductase n=1 Tax=Conexibacter stalactiti TaxID=1940611 RepID=A0ABU4HYD6_9ACTN|nr:SDR family oxidoreductase [Conexibacter stalactiti]MDW5597485.1 SDR family oxidoreductase [Conexibacter stalactiti]MEC5038127.1 SDR family oxidoreductase [Conexibacter stalactiti]
MTGRLTGKTALVTGATSGIGRAIAIAYAAEGAQVAVAGRDAERGAAVVAEIRGAGGAAEFVAADLATVAGVRQLADDATAALGGHVDVLVNNAGVYPPTPTVTVDETTFASVVDVNVRAPYFLVQALAPGMIERGGGVIVNLGSWVAQVGLAAGVLYAASKAMVEQLTRGWAAELGPSGVRVNAIAPGVTLTDGTAGFAAQLEPSVSALPAGRIGRPEEIAQAAVHLAGADAAYMHGATLLVDGGALSTRVF